MSNNYDLLAAIDESVVNKMFEKIKEDFKQVVNVDKSSGRYRIFGRITFDVPRGDILFVPGSSSFVRIDELDIRTDIDLTMQITLPEIALPSVCIPIPCNGEVCTPKIVLIPSTRINIPLILPPITSEISADGMIVPELDSPAGKWLLKLQLNPLTVDLDLVDIADTMGDLFESAARNILGNLFGPVGDIIYSIIGDPIEWLIRTVLDITDDITEWFMRFLSDTLGLHGILADFLVKITGKIVVSEIDENMEILQDEYSSSTPMTIRVADIVLDVNADHELMLGVTIEP